MAAVLETLPVAPTSKLQIWLLSKGRKKLQRDNKSWFLLICGMPGHLLYRFVASKGMQMVDQCGIALLGNKHNQQ